MIALTPADHETPVEDLNPAVAISGGVNLNTTRVVVLKNRVWVVRDDPKGPQVVFAEDIEPTSLHKESNKGYLTTISGKKLAWIKDNACGCGSRLRSWRPYKHVGSVADPTE